MADLILVNERDGVATVTLNRPEKRNALHGSMVFSLLQQLLQLAGNPHIRIVKINANGPDFCAGADLGWMKKMAEGPQEENVADAEHLSELMYTLYHFPKPTVVIAQGTILGGGLGILAASDIVLVSRSAKMGFSEVKIGLIPSTISPYVVGAIGERMARYYFLTGERFDAMEARRIGLAHQVVEADLLEEAGDRLIKELLANGPQAINAAKQLIHHVSQEVITPTLGKKLAQHLANIRLSKEVQEGLSAFIEKRKPVW